MSDRPRTTGTQPVAKPSLLEGDTWFTHVPLRLQIVVLVVSVLLGQALVSTLWLRVLMGRTLENQGRRAAQRVVERAAIDIDEFCPEFDEVCVIRRLDGIRAAGGFDRLICSRGRSVVTQGQPGPNDITVSTQTPLGTWLEADLVLNESRARLGELMRFQGANMLAALVLMAVFGIAAFNRFVVEPVERLRDVAEKIGHLELPDHETALGGLRIEDLTGAFGRLLRALRKEQDRTHRQIEELTGVNVELRSARDTLVKQEKLATVGRLAAGVAHEVGNPLGGILGYAELIKGMSSGPEREFAERIVAEVGRIDRIVRGLLDFSRPGGEDLGPVEVRRTVEAALALCRADKRFRDVEPVVELPERLPAIHGDEGRLRQVLVNLLLNAGDAMGGRGRIRIALGSIGPDGLRLLVDDEGPGIPADVMPRIFDPFFTTKEVGQGTGLGLSICAAILEGFGGEVLAENLPERGARFTLRLPLEPMRLEPAPLA